MFEILEPRILSSVAPSPIIPGDFTHNGVVDSSDFNVWFAQVGTAGPEADGNQSGTVDGTDFDLWFNHLGQTLYDGRRLTAGSDLNIWVPNPADFGLTWVASDPALLFGSDGQPTLTTIHQGSIADCYELAALGSLAINHPEKITARIAWDGTGYAVTWQDVNTGTKLIVHTAANLSLGWQIQGSEVWWEYFEKTYAFFRTWNGSTSQNSMLSTGYGFESVVWQQLVPPPTSLAQRNLSFLGDNQWLQAVANDLAAGHAITVDTTTTAPAMVQQHVYIVVSVDVQAQTILLYNPWGFYDTRSLADLKANIYGYAEVLIL